MELKLIALRKILVTMSTQTHVTMSTQTHVVMTTTIIIMITITIIMIIITMKEVAAGEIMIILRNDCSS
jgi:hypothetical protein